MSLGFGIGLMIKSLVASASVIITGALLMEDGSYLLMEDGSKILLE